MADNRLMFDRYTDRARRALVIAQDEARNLGHAHVGSGHLLLGLIGEDGGVAAQALKSLGNPAEMLLDARRVVSRTEDRAPSAPAGALPFTLGLGAVLEIAPRKAASLGDNYIATEHLLLALAAIPALGASPLVAIGVNPDDARAKVLELLRGYEEARKLPATPEPAAAAADDRLTALEEIGYLRACTAAAAAAPEGFDFAVLMPRLDRALAALDAVLDLTRSSDGDDLYPSCDITVGDLRAAISRGLTGEGSGDD